MCVRVFDGGCLHTPFIHTSCLGRGVTGGLGASAHLHLRGSALMCVHVCLCVSYVCVPVCMAGPWSGACWALAPVGHVHRGWSYRFSPLDSNPPPWDVGTCWFWGWFSGALVLWPWAPHLGPPNFSCWDGRTVVTKMWHQDGLRYSWGLWMAWISWIYLHLPLAPRGHYCNCAPLSNTFHDKHTYTDTHFLTVYGATVRSDHNSDCKSCQTGQE